MEENKKSIIATKAQKTLRIREIVRSSNWEEVEDILAEHLKEIISKRIETRVPEEVAIEALSRQIAYESLSSFLIEIGFFKEEERLPIRRRFN